MTFHVGDGGMFMVTEFYVRGELLDHPKPLGELHALVVEGNSGQKFLRLRSDGHDGDLVRSCAVDTIQVDHHTRVVRIRGTNDKFRQTFLLIPTKS